MEITTMATPIITPTQVLTTHRLTVLVTPMLLAMGVKVQALYLVVVTQGAPVLDLVMRLIWKVMLLTNRLLSMK